MSRTSSPWIPVIFILLMLVGRVAAEEKKRGTRSRVTIDAPSVQREMACNVLLPAGYEQSDRRYPVLYLLHGRGGNEDYWLDLGVIDCAAPYEMIVVMASATPSWFVNWSESHEGQKNDWEDFIVRDLVGYVDDQYRTIQSARGRAICGKSMGGYGALVLALRHPEVFGSTSCIAGGLRFLDKLRAHLQGEGPDPLLLTGEVPDGKRDLAVRTPRGRMVASLADCDAIDPFQLVLKVPREQLPDIRLDCGLDDSLLEASQRFARLLMENKIPFTFSQSPGAHTAEYGAEALRQTMAHQADDGASVSLDEATSRWHKNRGKLTQPFGSGKHL